jgi:hypothetical protein
MREGMLHPGKLGFCSRRDTVSPAWIASELLLPPVTAAERRVTDDRIGFYAGIPVGKQRVTG